MKKYFLLVACSSSVILAFAQDSTKVKSSFIGLRFSGVPIEKIAEADTTYQNELSISPIIDLRTKAGWGITYSPSILLTGDQPGLYLHTLSAGYEKYGGKTLDIAFNYSRYIFTHNTNVPYSPISNELFLSAAFNRGWLEPVFASSIGFGKDSTSKFTHEFALVGGVRHEFAFDLNGTINSVDLTPSLLLNAGTNGYFSFLQVSKYISNSHHFSSYTKHKGKGKDGSPSLELSNVELNMEAGLEKGEFSLRPNGSIFFPTSGTDRTVSAFAELTLQYSF
jgi:hypothetical protein